MSAGLTSLQRVLTTLGHRGETLGVVSVRTLAGLIPICAHCKQIRDDSGCRQSVEKYVQDHTDATLTHGICPACIEKYFPGVGQTRR